MRHDTSRRAGGVLKRGCDGEYYLAHPTNIIDAVVATGELARLYALKEYNDIFPDYSDETDSVRMYEYGVINILVHQREFVGEVTDDYIEGGVYMFMFRNGDLIIKPFPSVYTDTYIEMSNNTNVLIEDMNKFFDSEELYAELGIKYRRNALVYGPPGTGKTFSILQAAIEQIEKNDALVFFIPSTLHNLDELFFYSEPLRNRKVIFIIEEITERVKSDTEVLLNFLDGETSWESSYVIATTNYPEELEPNIVDRPGRFDMLLCFDNPTPEERKRYLENMLGHEVDDELIEKTEGFSFTYLKEVVVKSRLYGTEPIDIINENIKRKRLIKNSFKKSSDKFGF